MKTPSRPSFRPRLEGLEERCTPSASPAVPFKETLTVVNALPNGEIHYQGQATHFGKLSAVLYDDNAFVKTAANGDTAVGYITPASETTGTITLTGGTGRFQGTTGESTYVISLDQATGATTVDVTGTLTPARPAAQGGTRTVTLRINGGGEVPDGVPLFPGGTSTHTVAGTATHLGKHTSLGTFELLSIDFSTLTGTFRSAEPMLFVAANGDVLALSYGTTSPGEVTLTPQPDGRFVAVFIAEFTPDPTLSTGRFAGVTGGSLIMVATSEPFEIVPGQTHTTRFDYTWTGEGSLQFSNGKK